MMMSVIFYVVEPHNRTFFTLLLKIRSLISGFQKTQLFQRALNDDPEAGKKQKIQNFNFLKVAKLIEIKLVDLVFYAHCFAFFLIKDFLHLTNFGRVSIFLIFQTYILQV
jgi:hypothetical protein